MDRQILLKTLNEFERFLVKTDDEIVNTTIVNLEKEFNLVQHDKFEIIEPNQLYGNSMVYRLKFSTIDPFKFIIPHNVRDSIHIWSYELVHGCPILAYSDYAIRTYQSSGMKYIKYFPQIYASITPFKTLFDIRYKDASRIKVVKERSILIVPDHSTGRLKSKKTDLVGYRHDLKKLYNEDLKIGLLLYYLDLKDFIQKSDEFNLKVFDSVHCCGDRNDINFITRLVVLFKKYDTVIFENFTSGIYFALQAGCNVLVRSPNIFSIYNSAETQLAPEWQIIDKEMSDFRKSWFKNGSYNSEMVGLINISDDNSFRRFVNISDSECQFQYLLNISKGVDFEPLPLNSIYPFLN